MTNLKRQFMPMNEEIEMSHAEDWKKLIRYQLTLQQIPNWCFNAVLGILREDVSKKKVWKPKVKNVSMLYIDPLTVKISIWNFIIIFTAYFLLLQISLTLGFGPSFWANQIIQPIFYIAYISLLLLLLLDVIVNFNKGYYAFGYGKVIDDKMLIIQKYLKSYFIIDCIAIIFLIIPLITSHYLINLLQLVPLVLLFIKKFKCQAEITRALEYQYTARIVFILGMLGCDVMLLGNFGACIFLGIDILLWNLQFFGNNTAYYWLSNNTSYSVDLMGGPWIAQYVYAQSFSTGTLSTLAPGPFGKNPIQISIQLFIMIFFMILASYVGEVLISILYAKQQVRIFHDNNIMKFDHFMSLKGVAQKIKLRVHNFLQLIWEFEIKNQTQTEKTSIQKLPMSIQEDLLSEIGFSHEITFLERLSMGQQIQKIISFKIKSYIVDPDALIFAVGPLLDTLGQGYIYFIKNGLAKHYFQFNSQKKNNLPQQFQKTKRVVLIHNRLIPLLQLQFNRFMRNRAYRLQRYQVDNNKLGLTGINTLIKQQFQLLKCKIMLYNQLNVLNQTCLICDRMHRENKCTEIFVHEQIWQQLVNQQIQYKFNQRLPYRRSDRQKQIAKITSFKVEMRDNILKKHKSLNRPRGTRDIYWNTDTAYSYTQYYPNYNIQQ